MQNAVQEALNQQGVIIPTPGVTAILHGFYAVPGISLLVEIGLIEKWLAGETVNLEIYCRERNLDHDFVQSWCNYFQLYGYLEVRDSGLVPSAAGMVVIQRWPQFMLNYAYASLNAQVVPLARKEKEYGYGKEVYRDMYYDTKGAGGLGLLMSFGQIANHLRDREYRCLLDIGCGNGTFLATACKMFPGLMAVGVDQSEVAIAEAEKNFEQDILMGKGRFFQGDIMNPDTIFANSAMEGVDIATIMQIFQEITGDGLDPVIRFLESFRKHRPGVALAVAELYRLNIDEAKSYLPLGVLESHLHHHLSDQNLLRREQWIELYDQCGFEVIDNIVHVQAPSAPPVIETLVIKARS